MLFEKEATGFQLSNVIQLSISDQLWLKNWHSFRYFCLSFGHYLMRNHNLNNVVTAGQDCVMVHNGPSFFAILWMQGQPPKKNKRKTTGVKHSTPAWRQKPPFSCQPKHEKSMMSVARFNARSASLRVNHTPGNLWMSILWRMWGVQKQAELEKRMINIDFYQSEN